MVPGAVLQGDGEDVHDRMVQRFAAGIRVHLRRAARKDTVRLWHKIRTVEDPKWTERYHSRNPKVKAFGARVEIRFKDGSQMEDEMAVANAHPLGARPFERENYINKFMTLTDGIITQNEAERFIETAERLPKLKADELNQLNVQVPAGKVKRLADKKGIF